MYLIYAITLLYRVKDKEFNGNKFRIILTLLGKYYKKKKRFLFLFLIVYLISLLDTPLVFFFTDLRFLNNRIQGQIIEQIDMKLATYLDNIGVFSLLIRLKKSRRLDKSV